MVGDDCLIYQGVTLGMTGKSFSREGKRHPTLGQGVLAGAGAIVLGDITVGDHVNIGAGAVVVKPVPADSTVVGIAAHVIGDRVNCPADDSNWGRYLQTPPDLERRLDEVGREFGVERRLGTGRKRSQRGRPSSPISTRLTTGTAACRRRVTRDRCCATVDGACHAFIEQIGTIG